MQINSKLQKKEKVNVGFNISVIYFWIVAPRKSPCREHVLIIGGKINFCGNVLHGEPCLNFIYNQGQKVAQPFVKNRVTRLLKLKSMKRTCLQENTNTDEQTTCELHRVRKLIKETKYNRELISNFNILYT